LFDAAYADYIFMVPAENTPDFAGTGYNNMSNMAGADIEFNITDITESLAVPAVDDFLLPKLTDAHSITHIVSWFIICASACTVSNTVKDF
jgi:predicted naringenin-chalcone synthase